MKNYVLCDVHGHFLPGMDDGSRSVEESVNMLKAAKNQGVERMFATPHYYPVESVQTFLARRQESAQKLAQALQGHEQEVPAYQLGAEVAYRQGIGYAENLELLCLGNSEYLLLEMPFAAWRKDVLRDVCNMVCSRGITPVLAHVERYLKFQAKDTLMELLDQGVLMQINAGTLLHRKTRRMAMKLLKQGVVRVLGSDCHDLEERHPNLGMAVELLEHTKGMEPILNDISNIGLDIFG